MLPKKVCFWTNLNATVDPILRAKPELKIVMNPSTDITARVTTGIPGLDDVLNGGLPQNRLYLIHGNPGVGKTTFALQFLLEGQSRGESCLYVTLSETGEELAETARSHGWSLDGINVFELADLRDIRAEAGSTFFRPSEIELNRTTEKLEAEVRRVKPTRIVLDSLSELRLLSETALRYRRQIMRFKHVFAGLNCTVLFLEDDSSGEYDVHIESIAHGVIKLQRTEPEYGITRRVLSVIKLRGSAFREGNHDFVLRHGGITVFPRLVAAEYRNNLPSETVACGIPELDALLGGGIDRGTSNVFMGPAGCGKSTLALKSALAAAARGERASCFIFDETLNTFITRASKLGMELEPAMQSGLIEVHQIDPAEISPGELSHRIRDAVEKRSSKVVIIDSINGYLQAMPGERYLTLQLHEILSYLNQQGIITIMTVAQQGVIGQMQNVVDLTYLADTVLLLRFYEDHGTVKQAISVIKKRSGNHERTIRELRLVEGSGIEVGKPVSNLQGVLTGVPTLVEGNVGPDHARVA